MQRLARPLPKNYVMECFIKLTEVLLLPLLLLHSLPPLQYDFIIICSFFVVGNELHAPARDISLRPQTREHHSQPMRSRSPPLPSSIPSTLLPVPSFLASPSPVSLFLYSSSTLGVNVTVVDFGSAGVRGGTGCGGRITIARNDSLHGS